MIAPKEKAMSTLCGRRSKEMCTIESLAISKRPEMTVMVYRSIAEREIQMMLRNPRSVPSVKADTAVVIGMQNTRNVTRNASKTP